ncbi:CFEM domain containing protein [Pyrenophora tritici-repentis]|uniref:CFEM domain containing protein n=2 Tax=Pyrenophora tritici-repentis TaxID=45151 RepID=A0A2W1H5W5_9PLEO|nr:CFEM domain-containing protein [Pyrenophora tritici-repentis]KAF7451295.1 hypothetical protein A1F99_030720 [Pyrenophora tritici-repentis]KAF7575596.1 CFEM domain containing protein [Pyrenophora tritici-repentis]KAG9385660.1 CFEM domain containing protein [Pyrenophora tritici-repentis]KAI0579293.1 CFEM domain-containing protein [Pyrenophora tritici-repentis]
MRYTVPLILMAAVVVLASPVTSTSIAVSRKAAPPPPPGPPGPKGGPMMMKPGGPGIGGSVANVGPCPMDCWNQAAATAGCDPNVDDKCLCGPFFDAVTKCTAAACSIGENLSALNVLNPPCQ